MNTLKFPPPSGDHVVLVDEHDRDIGVAEKLTAHQQGMLHRAFSVFLFRLHNDEYETLLQQRGQDKYHCGGLWSNTCCSHPRPGEEVMEAAERRLREELGIIAGLHSLGYFQYRAVLDNGLTEHEVDHVLLGRYDDGDVSRNHDEVQAFAWMPVTKLQQELTQAPQRYTPWLALALQRILDHPQALANLF